MWFALWSPLAWSKEIVVAASASEGTVAAGHLVSSGVSAESFEVRAWSDVMSTRPAAAVGAARTETCDAAPASLSTVRFILDKLESAVAWMNDEEAASLLVQARRALVCLREPVDPAVGSRIYMLGGVASVWTSDLSTARAYFEQAVRMNPALEWDDKLTPAARTLFEEARGAVGKQALVALTLVPAEIGAQTSIDGVRASPDPAASLAISPGMHFVQVGTGPCTTFGLEVPAGADVALVMPSLVSSMLLEQLADEGARRRTGQVLAAVMGTGVGMYVHGAGATWSITTGSDAWRLVGGTPVPYVPMNRRSRQRWLLTTGVLGVAAGGAYGAAALTARSFHDPSTPTVELSDLRTRTNALATASAAMGLLAVGAAVVGVTQ